jgi:PilZ domain
MHASAPAQGAVGLPQLDTERRVCVRRTSMAEAASRPIGAQDTLSWAAQVRDLSSGGIGLVISHPFRPGTYVAIDLQRGTALARSLLARVVHANEQPGGTWSIGCEFVKPLTQSDVDLLI